MSEADKILKEVKSDRTVMSIQSAKLKREKRINRTHVILDIYKCEDKSLAKANLLEQKVKKILEQFNLESSVQTFYQFQPFGVTAIVYAKSVQFTVHTWPEYKSAAVDLYSFDGRKLATDLCQELRTAFKSSEYEMKVRRR